VGFFDWFKTKQADTPGSEPTPAKLTFYNEVAAVFGSTNDQARRDDTLNAGVKTARYRAQELFKDIRAGRALAVKSLYDRYNNEAKLNEPDTPGLIEGNPLTSVPKDFFEDAYRSWASEGGIGIPPWQRLGVAVKEGWLQDKDHDLHTHWDVTTKDQARTLWRTRFFYSFVGLDHFCFYIVHEGDNEVQLFESSVPDHEQTFFARANQVRPGMAAQINAAILVEEDKARGGYNVTPTPRFYELTLQLTSAYFLENVGQVEGNDPGLAYMRWNLGKERYQLFLASVARHMKEPGNTANIASEWAFRTKMKSDEYGKVRKNALTSMFFTEVYRMVFENVDWKAK